MCHVIHCHMFLILITALQWKLLNIYVPCDLIPQTSVEPSPFSDRPPLAFKSKSLRPYNFKAESKRVMAAILWRRDMFFSKKDPVSEYLSKWKHPFYVENTVANMMKCIWPDSMCTRPMFCSRVVDIPWDHRKRLYAVLLGIQGFAYVFQADSIRWSCWKLGKFTPGDADATCLSCRRCVMRWIWKVQRCFEGGTLKFYAVWQV